MIRVNVMGNVIPSCNQPKKNEDIDRSNMYTDMLFYLIWFNMKTKHMVATVAHK